MFKHFYNYDKATLASSFQPRSRPSRQHRFQLHRQKTAKPDSNQISFLNVQPRYGTNYRDMWSKQVMWTNSKRDSTRFAGTTYWNSTIRHQKHNKDRFVEVISGLWILYCWNIYINSSGPWTKYNTNTPSGGIHHFFGRGCSHLVSCIKPQNIWLCPAQNPKITKIVES